MNITRRNTFTFLLCSLNDGDVLRAAAYMRAIHQHAGRAWVMLDAPLSGMPPRIIGAAR